MAMSVIVFALLAYFIYRNMLDVVNYGPIATWTAWHYIQLFIVAVLTIFAVLAIIYTVQEIREKISKSKKKQAQQDAQEQRGTEIVGDGDIVVSADTLTEAEAIVLEDDFVVEEVAEIATAENVSEKVDTDSLELSDDSEGEEGEFDWWFDREDDEKPTVAESLMQATKEYEEQKRQKKEAKEKK